MKPAVCRVLSAQMRRDGIEFYRSVTGVCLVTVVPVRYLQKQSAKS